MQESYKMANSDSKRVIPVLEGLWTTPSSADEKPHLIGSRCPACGELCFPKKEKGLCVHCQNKGLEDVKLGREGKIATFTVVMIPPAGGYYKGPVPYAYGAVNLKDEVELYTLFTGDLDELRVGMDVEMVIEKLFDDDEGNEVMTYKFRPIKK